MQQLNVCLICLVTLKIRDVTKVFHIEETEIADQILPKLSVKIDTLVEIASLPNPA